jgi:hypothetical protein
VKFCCEILKKPSRTDDEVRSSSSGWAGLTTPHRKREACCEMLHGERNFLTKWGQRQRYFPSSPLPDRLWSLPNTSNECCGLVPRGLKCLGREAGHSPPYSAEFQSVWSYTFTPPYIFIAWCLIKRQGQFYVYIYPLFSEGELCSIQFVRLDSEYTTHLPAIQTQNLALLFAVPMQLRWSPNTKWQSEMMQARREDPLAERESRWMEM